MTSIFPASRSASTWAVHAAGALVAIGVAVVFYNGLYAPMRRDAADRSRRIHMLHSLTATGDDVVADHDQLSARLAALQAVARASRDRMPRTMAAGEFVDQATRLAKALGLEVNQLQSGNPQRHESHAVIDVTCQLQGSFASMCRFLAAVDQLPQLSRISRLDVARSGDSSGYPLDVTFQLYYQVDPLDKDPQRGTL